MNIKTGQVTFPIDKIQATFKVHGLYAIPDEWKTLDDANPGLFTYATRMSKFQVLKGKICPRQLSERQKKQVEQKSKKGGKKQSKNPQQNEEEQRLKKLQEERERQRQQQFAKLSQQQQFYYNSEDIYRSPFLKFEDNLSQISFEGNDCLIFQSRLLKDRGDWIYVYKMPAVSQDQLAKMKKTKPKTINNINDLNPVVMRAWVSFDELASGEKTEIKQLRCKIQQVDKSPETPQPNLQKTYIKVSFSLRQPIVRQKDSYSTAQLINDPENPKQKSQQEKVLDELKQQISLAIQSLAMQYSAMFWKQLNIQKQQKVSQVFLQNKKGELMKRKQQFLYDFNVTGKYKILKDRIKKCIVHLCQNKFKSFFAGMKSFNGIKYNNQDQIYSEIYNLMVTSYQERLFEIICDKQQALEQVLVINNQTIKQKRQQILNTYKQESILERVKRTIREYEVVQDHQYAEKVIAKYIQEYPQITELKYLYGSYCLKYNIKTAKEVLPFIQEYLKKQKLTLTDQKKVEFMIILLNIGGQNNIKGWIIIREVIEKIVGSQPQPAALDLARWLLLASFVLKSMQNDSLSQKYRSFALKEYKKFLVLQQNPNQPLSNHKQAPSKSQIPSMNAAANYSETGSLQDLKNLYDSLISFLDGFSCYELIKKIQAEKMSLDENQLKNEDASLQRHLPEINELLVRRDEDSLKRLLELALRLQVNLSSAGNNEEKNKVNEIIIKAYLVKINLNKNNQDLDVLQTYLKKSLLTNNEAQSRFKTLLRLSYVYCQKKQFGNARACLLKYLQKSVQFPSYLSGLSYKLLGVSCLKLGRIDEAIENFKHWNLCDIKNRDAWLYLALGYTQQKQMIVVNQCLREYKKRCINEASSPQQKEILSQIRQKIKKVEIQSQSQYSGVLKEKILEVLA